MERVLQVPSAGEMRITNPPISVRHCKCRTAGLPRYRLLQHGIARCIKIGTMHIN